MSHQESLRKLVYSLLDDDEGISETAWDDLVQHLREQGAFTLLAEVREKISACNNRRYIV
jgi:hypothetical protein